MELATSLLHAIPGGFIATVHCFQEVSNEKTSRS
jgi:hypothetical protein